MLIIIEGKLCKPDSYGVWGHNMYMAYPLPNREVLRKIRSALMRPISALITRQRVNVSRVSWSVKTVLE